MPPPIGAREIDGLPCASVAELPVTQCRTYFCHLTRSGKSPTNLEAVSWHDDMTEILLTGLDMRLDRLDYIRLILC